MSVSSHSELLRIVRQKQIAGKKAMVAMIAFSLPPSGAADSIVRSLKQRVRSLVTSGAERVLPFGPSEFAVVADQNKATGVLQKIRALDDFLDARKMGRLTIQAFDLPNDSHKVFHALLGKAIDDKPDSAGSEGLDETRAKEVDSLIAIEKMLRRADISNLVRERPVICVTVPGRPKPVQRELVVDVAEISRLARTNISAKPWLLSEVTRILDSKMLSHLLHEPSHCQDDISINLHLDTVLSDAFQNFVESVDTARTTLPSVELDFAEIKALPDLAKKVIKRLRSAECRIAIDGIPAAQLMASSSALPEINGLYKFDWRNSVALDAKTFDASTVSKAIQSELDRIGRENCVLLHCHSPRVIENALKLGFTQLEGFEAYKYLTGPRLKAVKPTN